MKNNKFSFDQIARWIAAKCLGTQTPEEAKQLEEWLEAEPRFHKVYEKLLHLEHYPDEIGISEKEGWKKFIEKYPVNQKQHWGKRQWYYVVASCLAVFLGSALFFTIQQGAETVLPTKELQPAERIYGACLITGDGQVMALTDHSQQDTLHLAATVVVSREGIGYITKEQTTNKDYHTIVVPKYGEYTVRLGDGSQIRINSESKLRYPSCFTDSIREVWLTGEAYFEVARNTTCPFIVHAGEVDVNVLGTEFNMKAVPDDGQVTTTLVKGRVCVRHGEASCILSPGEQAVAEFEREKLEKRPADIRAVTAWIRGMFCFNEANLDEIMQCLAKWYGFKVEYRDPAIKKRKFSIELKRYEKVDNILKLMEETGTVHFHQEGIVVTIY